MNEVDFKINSIKKFFKTTDLFLEIFLLNYESCNLYIRIDYIKRLKVYKLSWFNLEVLNVKKIERYMGSEYINSQTVEYIANIISGHDNNFHEETENNVVVLNAYFDNGYHYQFAKFIPKELSFLCDVFSIIFSNLPKKLEEFLYELHAEVMETKSRYDYLDEFIFDIYKDDLSKLFDEKVIQYGNHYCKNEHVLFLEKIDDKYYSIVNGISTYLNIVKYDEKTNKTQFYCTCPCEFNCKHIYAVLKAIRKNRTRKFYKVLYIDKDNNLVENAINYKFLLCFGVEDECLKIINKYGEIQFVPVVDQDNELNFKIIEDDENNTLENKIKKIVNGK